MHNYAVNNVVFKLDSGSEPCLTFSKLAMCGCATGITMCFRLLMLFSGCNSENQRDCSEKVSGQRM